ncbi:MAG: PAS domain-containing protein [Acidimicrobiia bacterium]|nr:PAS domain-containing protein [Acidimicrobiia bacterium]
MTYPQIPSSSRPNGVVPFIDDRIDVSAHVLAAMLNSIEHHVWWKDRDGRILGCNDAFARSVGLSTADDAYGLTDRDLALPAAQIDSFEAEDQIIRSTRTAILNHEKAVDMGTATVHISVSKIPVFDDGGNYAGMVGLAVDVTERVSMEEQLIADFQLFDKILANIPYQIVWKDRDHRYLGANAAFRDLIGVLTNEELADLDATTLSADQRAILDAIEASSEAVMASGVAQLRQPVTVADPAGRARHLDVSRVPLTGGRSEPTGIVLIAADVTNQRDLEAQLSEASKFEALGQLAAGVAHEINTPVQYVGDNLAFLSSGSVELIELLRASRAVLEQVASTMDGEPVCQSAASLLKQYEITDVEFLADEVPAAIHQSLEGMRRVTKIVRALKEFAHPGGDDPEPTDVNHLVESTVSVASNEWKYVAEVELDLQTDLPPVDCQPAQLSQVVLILMVNAAQAIGERPDSTSKQGRITISTRADHEVLRLTIADTGGGIPDDVLPRIFDPFFTTKDVGVGSGQGLSLAHKIITKNHGGSLAVDSQVGVGTTITVIIPLKAAAADPAGTTA